MAKKKLRPLGDITQDMEPLLFEMSVDHDLQHGEVLAKIYSWLKIHVPDQAEKYIAGGQPDLPKIFGFKEISDERRDDKRSEKQSQSGGVRQAKGQRRKR